MAVRSFNRHGSRRRIKQYFRDLWSNDDVFKYRMSREVLAGTHQWIEAGLVDARPAARPRPQEVSKVS